MTRLMLPALLLAGTALGQPPAPPGVMVPKPKDEAMQRSLGEQKKAFAERQACLARNSDKHRLYVATQDLIEIRDSPKGAPYLDEAFTRYKAAGGTAATPAGVTRAVDPCPIRK